MEFQIKPFYETGLFPLKTPKIQRFSSKGEMSKFSTNWGDSPFPPVRKTRTQNILMKNLKMEYLLGNIIYLQKQQPEVLYEIDVLKILQNSQENTFAGFCFFFQV